MRHISQCQINLNVKISTYAFNMVVFLSFSHIYKTDAFIHHMSYTFPKSYECRMTKEEIGNDTSHIACCQNNVKHHTATQNWLTQCSTSIPELVCSVGMLGTFINCICQKGFVIPYIHSTKSSDHSCCDWIVYCYWLFCK